MADSAMMLAASPFLSDPSEPSPLLAALAWVEGTLLGSIATAIAVICVAVVGLMMFSGRLDVRRGLVVVLGCFVLFGASTIIDGFRGAIDKGPPIAAAPVITEPPAAVPTPPPSQAYDPYAGASVIRR